METDVLAHNVSIVPGTRIPAFGFRFPPPIMAGHIVQHLVECRAHVVVFLPDAKAYWFPFGSACHRKVDRGGPGGGGRVLSVVQFGWWPQDLAVPLLGDDCVRDRLP